MLTRAESCSSFALWNTNEFIYWSSESGFNSRSLAIRNSFIVISEVSKTVLLQIEHLIPDPDIKKVMSELLYIHRYIKTDAIKENY